MKKKTYSFISHIHIIGFIFENRTSPIYQIQGELFHWEEIPVIKEYIKKCPNDQLTRQKIHEIIYKKVLKDKCKDILEKSVNRFFIKGEISDERKYK